MNKALGEKGKAVIPLVLFALCFSVYLMTLAPTITWRNYGTDGGDLIAAAYTLGIPHPPGYPTYVLLAKLFTLVPIGDIAYRVNVMSAVFAAATVSLLYLTILACLKSSSPVEDEPRNDLIVVATAATLAFGFSPVFWSQATIAEVYTLNAFFVTLLIYLVLRETPEQEREGQSVIRPLPLVIAFLYGLSLGNHLSMFLLAPMGFILILGKKRRLDLRTLSFAFLSFVLGLSVYLYLPLRAAQNPPINWGAPYTWPRFLWVVSGSLYRQFVFALPWEHVPERLSAWARLVIQQFGWWGLTLGLIGLWRGWWQDRSLLISSFLFFSLTSAYAIGYNTMDSHVYLIPTFLTFSIWLGWGARFVLVALGHYLEKTRRNLLWGQIRAEVLSSTSRVVLSLSALLLLCLPFYSLFQNFPFIDLSSDRTAYDYGLKALAIAAPKAIIITDTDADTFALWYLRYGEGKRPDVAVLNAALLLYDWYRDNVRRSHPWIAVREDIKGPLSPLESLMAANLSRHPIYLTRSDHQLPALYSLTPQGPLYRVVRR